VVVIGHQNVLIEAPSEAIDGTADQIEEKLAIGKVKL
jgi:hypothetical protein